MIDSLDRVVEDISTLNRGLALLIGAPGSGKSKLLRQLSERRQTSTLNVGAALGRELVMVPSTRRHLHAAERLKGLEDRITGNELILMDNIEILFDRTLQLNPLDLLKRHAKVRRVVAAWPGECQGDRLSYAATGHPEHQDYSTEDLVLFNVQ